MGTDPLNFGPDLLGVTETRDLRWLQRWILEPEKVLAEGDPIATELFERFGGITMPNTGLSAEQVNSVIGFLRGEHQRLTEPRTAKAPVEHSAHSSEHGEGHPPHH